MATVTGFTAVRMLEIENTTVVDGEVIGDNLILEQRDGTLINAGNVRGKSGAASYTQGVVLPVVKLNTSGPMISITNRVTEQPPGLVYAIDWTPDGRFLAVAHANGAGASIYRYDGVSIFKVVGFILAHPSLALEWSPEGRFLAASTSGTPHFYVLKFRDQDNAYEYIPSPSVTPTGVVYDLSWSPDGQFLAVTHANSPRLSIYAFDGLSLVKISSPETLPSGTGASVSWSPDGRFLAIGHQTSPFISVYNFQGTVLTKIANPTVLPSGNVKKVAWSPNGRFLIVGHENAPYLTLYSFNGVALTKVSAHANFVVPSSTVVGFGWSPDGRYLTALTNTSEATKTYFFNGSNLTHLYINPTGVKNRYDAAWSPDGSTIALAAGTSPFLEVFNTLATHYVDGEVDLAYI